MQDAPTLHRFAHEAMATTFHVVVAARTASRETALYAAQAAQAVFAEIDRIERDLSDFIDSSDVSRINHLGAKQPGRVSKDTFDCLELAARVYRDTDGVFDVTIGALMAAWRTRDGKAKSPSPQEIAAARGLVGMDKLVFDPEQLTIGLKVAGVQIDLGGIGKGYALDKAAEVLAEWREDAPDITGTLLNGGESTVLAVGTQGEEEGWRVSVAGDLRAAGMTQEIVLRDRALGGSSTRELGRHIIDPRTARPANAALRSWASAPTAAVADALSTAFMIMTPTEVERYCQLHTDTWAILLIREGQSRKLQQYGKR